MIEARLFRKGTIPEFTKPEFFAAHPWITPTHQVGHEERTAMASRVIHQFISEHPVKSVVDLGCGDGSLLNLLSDIDLPMWGYDLGEQNAERARTNGVDVRLGDILDHENIEWGDLIVATETLEHLLDPHGFVQGLPGNKIILTSPSAETKTWHYEHHAWAWDLRGYARMVTNAGWTVIHQEECEAPAVTHCGQLKPQRFQALVATK